MSRLVLRADAGPSIGAGHVMRCLALAEAWRRNGDAVSLVTCCNDERLLERVAAAGVDAEVMPAEAVTDASALLRVRSLLTAPEPPVVVIDGYRFGAEYLSAVRAAGNPLLVIDDTGQLPEYDADFLLNQNLGWEEIEYDVRPDTTPLMGSRFALLRSEFQPGEAGVSKVPAVARRVLVTVGGSDAAGIAPRVVSALRRSALSSLEVRVVGGGLARSPAASSEVEAARREGMRVELIRDARNMAEQMKWADLAISAAGSTAWELCRMGVPALLIVVAENQRGVADGLHARGAAVNLGNADEVDAQRLLTAFEDLARDEDFRRSLARSARRLVDGGGAGRVADVLRGFARLRSAAGPVRLCRATAADSYDIWSLRNEESVRAGSFDPEPIPWERHQQWLARKLESPDAALWVLRSEDRLAAQIRYDVRSDGCAEISFAVAPALRGRGVASHLLALTAQLVCDRLSAERIRGVTFADNAGSARAFEKAGFREREGEIIQGRECRIFERRISRS